MSLESLFQHILFTEHQAEESRRELREGRVVVPWGGGGQVPEGGGLGAALTLPDGDLSEDLCSSEVRNYPVSRED